MLKNKIKKILFLLFIFFSLDSYSQENNILISIENIEITQKSINIIYKITNKTTNVIWFHKNINSQLCIKSNDTIIIAPVYVPGIYNYSDNLIQFEGLGFNEGIFEVETIKVNPNDTLIAYFNYYNNYIPIDNIIILGKPIQHLIEDYTKADFIDITLIFTHINSKHSIRRTEYNIFLKQNAIFIKNIFKIRDDPNF